MFYHDSLSQNTISRSRQSCFISNHIVRQRQCRLPECKCRFTEKRLWFVLCGVNVDKFSQVNRKTNITCTKHPSSARPQSFSMHYRGTEPKLFLNNSHCLSLAVIDVAHKPRAPPPRIIPTPKVTARMKMKCVWHGK